MTYSQYIYSILSLTVDKHLFTSNNQIHKYNTRNNNNLHPTLTNWTKYNKGPYIYQVLKYSKHFRPSLKMFLYHHYFYSMEEYYEYKENTL